MRKEELRLKKQGGISAVGDTRRELQALDQLQEKSKIHGIQTVTVTCGEFFSIICC